MGFDYSVFRPRQTGNDMYNPNTGDNREYTLYNKYTGQVANTYHTRSAAEAAQNAKEAEKDWSWRIRTIVLR